MATPWKAENRSGYARQRGVVPFEFFIVLEASDPASPLPASRARQRRWGWWGRTHGGNAWPWHGQHSSAPQKRMEPSTTTAASAAYATPTKPGQTRGPSNNYLVPDQEWRHRAGETHLQRGQQTLHCPGPCWTCALGWQHTNVMDFKVKIFFCF